MAGDLFIMNITEDEMNVIIQAGGQIERSIYHANRDKAEAWTKLEIQLTAQQQKRVGLPPHAYIRFTRNQYKKSALLENFLAKVSRPLGVVTNQPALQNWNQTIHNRADYLEQALEKIAVILEYYKYGNQKLLDAPFAKDFKRIDEQSIDEQT
ncbi:hypothetical protein NIES4074_56000 [Cylindrospermum sp. NIES-4074]|nr:hypothetical protein NIES4074_56000 [Cylindrospermum sp. NIES-4074]